MSDVQRHIQINDIVTGLNIPRSCNSVVHMQFDSMDRAESFQSYVSFNTACSVQPLVFMSLENLSDISQKTAHKS